MPSPLPERNLSERQRAYAHTPGGSVSGPGVEWNMCTSLSSNTFSRDKPQMQTLLPTMTNDIRASVVERAFASVLGEVQNANVFKDMEDLDPYGESGPIGW